MSNRLYCPAPARSLSLPLRALPALALMCAATTGLAADGAIHAAAAHPAGTPGKILTGLLLVLALIGMLGWWLKRLSSQHGASARHIRLVESCPLGTRERLLLVAVGQQQLLLAAGSNGIQMLHLLPQALPETSTGTGGAAFAAQFAAQLAQFLPSPQRGRT